MKTMTESSMKVAGLDHVTIRTGDLASARQFFIDVLDLEERPRPAAIQRIPGHWLYQGDEPLVHLIGSAGGGLDRGGEGIDHVGFRMRGYEDFLTKLESLGVRHSLMDLPELDERRVFFHAPGGSLLEAVFSEPIPSHTRN